MLGVFLNCLTAMLSQKFCKWLKGSEAHLCMYVFMYIIIVTGVSDSSNIVWTPATTGGGEEMC